MRTRCAFPLMLPQRDRRDVIPLQMMRAFVGEDTVKFGAMEGRAEFGCITYDKGALDWRYNDGILGLPRARTRGRPASATLERSTAPSYHYVVVRDGPAKREPPIATAPRAQGYVDPVRHLRLAHC